MSEKSPPVTNLMDSILYDINQNYKLTSAEELNIWKKLVSIKNQTLADVKKIIDKFYGDKERNIEEDDFAYALWLVKKEIKQLESQETVLTANVSEKDRSESCPDTQSPESTLTGLNSSHKNGIQDTRKGCGKRYIPNMEALEIECKHCCPCPMCCNCQKVQR